VRDLKEQGVPIHGAGFQGHFIPMVDPVGLQQNMERIAALGLVVELTEVDVIRRNRPDALAFQGREYYGLAAACLAVPACRRITMWGFTDRYTWIDASFGPGFAPLPLDVDYQRKPAYFGLRNGILSTTTPADGCELRIRDDATRPERRSLEVRTIDAVDAPALGGTADPTVHGGVVALSSVAFSGSWQLPASGWRALAGGRGYKYRSSSGPVKRVLMKDGKRILVRLRGSGLGLDLDVDPTPLGVALSTGNASWCMAFDSALVFRPGKLLVSMHAPAPVSCPAPRLVDG